MGMPNRGPTWPDHGQNQGKRQIRFLVVFAPQPAPLAPDLRDALDDAAASGALVTKASLASEVRFGSSTDMPAVNCDVRFSLESRR